MSLGAILTRPFSFGKLTQTAGTVISRFVPPIKGYRPNVQKVVFTNAATAHTLTILAPLARCKLSAAAAAAASSIVLNHDPGDYSQDHNGDTKGHTPSVADNLIASGDYIAIKQPDGNWSVGTAGTCTTNSDGTVTVAYTVPTGGFVAGAEVQFFGVAADTNPNTGLAHQNFAGVASETVVFEHESGIASGPFLGDGLLIQSNNATNAGTIDRVEGSYGP